MPQLSRLVCIVLGRHALAAVLVRAADGSVRPRVFCASCGAAY